ncbi:hypothetical protein AC1031_013988 [Aphanomyces cochlioides]|nr:hypothetical protein AC1031_013988 [Aphanomyces cochlioides]
MKREADRMIEAAKKGHIDSIRALLTKGASIDKADEVFGETPLYVASEEGHLDVVKELLEQGASIDNANKVGGTPLCVASMKGHLDVVKELLALGASIDKADRVGRTPLYVASEEGRLDVIKELLAHGASIDNANQYGGTPLYVASEEGHLDVVKELVAQSASIDKADRVGRTPLYEASEEGHLDVVKELLAHGASIDNANRYGRTPLNVASMKGHLDVVKELLEQGASIDKAEEDGRTPLYVASEEGRLDVVKELLAHGASIDNANQYGRTPLYAASMKGQLDVVKEMLEQGASIEKANQVGRTPLYVASEEGRLDVVKELLAHGASIDNANQYGGTPLYVASMKGHLDVVKELLAQGASIDKAEEVGRTPLYVASEEGRLDVIKELLAQGASIEIVDEVGRTPLCVVSSLGHFDVVKELIVLGAAIDVRDKGGCTPLHGASRYGHFDVVKELLARGATTRTRDKDGSTALYWASYNGHFKVVEQLLICDAIVDIASWDGRTPLYVASGNGHLKVVEELLYHGADLDKKAWDDSTSLHVALWHGHFPVVKLLVDRGISINKSDWCGLTPLHVASISRNGHVDIVDVLLAHGADVSAKDKYGNRPLHCASFWGHYDVVKSLLDHGAYVNIANKKYYTPLHLAAKRRRLEIVQLILSSGGDMKKKSKDGKTARDLGNIGVKKIFDSFQERNLQMSIHSATELIRKAIDDMNQRTSKFFKVARSIFMLSTDIRQCRMSILSTTLILETIVRHIMVHHTPHHAHAVLPVMLDIKTLWWNIRFKTNPLKMTLGNNQEVIQTTIDRIVLLHKRLIEVSKNIPINLNFQVVGNIEDFRIDASDLMGKMESLDEYVKAIMNQTEIQKRRDGLNKLAIQINRGFEHYERDVAFGNLLRLNELDIQFKFCLDRISAAFQDMRRSQNLPETFGLGNIESWMLTPEDIQYDLSTPLGRGGFATVFKGMYYGQAVAVKRFDQILSADSVEIEKVIEKEIKAWKDVSHEPYILTLVGVCTKIQTPILVSELCETNIRRYIRDWPEALLPMIYQFACGLAFLHSKNIIHRDLKGDNVLITFQKTVAIADFGLSRSTESLKNTRTGIKVSGTLNWMSPEQFFRPRSLTTKSDIWSFGMTIWEILCNDTPYRDCSEYEFQDILKSEDDRPEKPEDLNPYFEPLWTLITKCWQLEPNARPSANDIVRFLEWEYNAQDMPHHQESFDECINDSDISDMEDIDDTVTSLNQLIQLIVAEPSREWPLLNNYVLRPRIIGTANQGIFRAYYQRQPWKHLAVTLSENSHEMDFYKNVVDIEKAKGYTVECFGSGAWYVRGYKCFAVILQRGGKNCESYCQYLLRDSIAKYRFIEQILAATQFLHNQGWIHGDIKLENVAYFEAEERFKLMNMDHAQKIDAAISNYCISEYCPPELAMYILGQKKILVASAKFDTWCVAVLVLKLFVKDGVLKEFSGLDEKAIIQLIASPDFNLDHSLNASDLKPPQKQILALCLHPDPQKRGTLDDMLAILPERRPSSSNSSRSIPFAWRLDGAIEPQPRGKALREMSLRLTSLCEMRESSSRCEHFYQDASIQVKADSTFVRDALPFLKTSSLVIKAIGLVSCYDILFGSDYNFDMSDGIDVEKTVLALQNIHGVVSTIAPPRLVEIVNHLENGDLEEDEVKTLAKEIKRIIEDHRKNNIEVMSTALRTLGLRLDGGVIGGLTKRTIKSQPPFEGSVRWVCRRHAEEFDEHFC